MATKREIAAVALTAALSRVKNAPCPLRPTSRPLVS